MKKFVLLLFLILVVGLILATFGPRPDMSIESKFDAKLIGNDLDVWLADSERKVSNIRPNAAKELIWHDESSKDKTEFAIVYLHGFSASKVEIAPVPQKVANVLGANLYLTRLTGHGRNADAMAEANLSNWIDDTKEAIEIGTRIGEKVVLLSGSTGGTLATWAAIDPEQKGKIHSVVSVSANYGIKGASIGMLNMPWAETLLPLIFGNERSFEPSNDAHAKGWTTRYPSSAIFPMAALLRLVSEMDKSKATAPHFFIYSEKDSVVEYGEIEKVRNSWGGETEKMIINDSKDPHNHVIAGDILSPNTTERTTTAITDWVKKL